MNILIIEDEPQAAQRLETLVEELLPGSVVLAKLDTVKKSVQWFNTQTKPDVVLMDIHLADGISFQIFEQCEIHAPIIFVTAYDAYAIKAFQVSSIDYILKPVSKEDLSRALNKLRNLQANAMTPQVLLANIGEVMKQLSKKYKNRFVIKVGEHLKTIEIANILFFFSQDKTSFCVTEEGRNHILDYTLDDLTDMIDPEHFFRINRKYLVRLNSISDIITYSNSRLRLVLKNCSDTDVIVAREKVQLFKEWLDM